PGSSATAWYASTTAGARAGTPAPPPGDRIMRGLIPSVLSITLPAGCTNTPSDPATGDSPPYGAVRVLADQDLRYVIESERKMFEAIYADAKLEIRYMPERELARAMLNDSVRLVFSYFVPGADQEAYFKTRSL